jgi:hypothetical protein
MGSLKVEKKAEMLVFLTVGGLVALRDEKYVDKLVVQWGCLEAETMVDREAFSLVDLMVFLLEILSGV